MDFATLGGLLIGLGAVILSYLMEGGHLTSLLQAPAMILVIFGTIGASTITTSIKQLLSAPVLVKVALFEERMDPLGYIDLIAKFADRARKEGLLALEGMVKTVENGFLRKGLQLAIDGMEPQQVREILENEMIFMSERHKAGATFFQKLGGFSPTLGIIGTVLGLIHTLGNMEDASKLASSIAGAFIATLWGVALANLIYLPLGDKLKHKHQGEELIHQLILEGVLSIQMGENPRVIRTKLMSFLTPKLRQAED